MGTSSSKVFMSYVADTLLASTHGFVLDTSDAPYDKGFMEAPWTVHNGALRVAYMVLVASSRQSISWDAAAQCARVRPLGGDVKALAVTVARRRMQMTKVWEFQIAVGDALLREHRVMHDAIGEAMRARKDLLLPAIPLLLPSANESVLELVLGAARAACEDFLVSCSKGGWVDEMTDPSYEPKSDYERDKYPSRAFVLRQLLPHLHEELMAMSCLRQARDAARRALAEARDRVEVLVKFSPADVLQPAAIVLAHVASVDVNAGSPGESTLSVRPEETRRQGGKKVPAREVVPTDGDVVDKLTALLAAALEGAYMERAEAMVGGPAAAAALGRCVVDAVYDAMRSGWAERVESGKEGLKAQLEAIGAAITEADAAEAAAG